MKLKYKIENGEILAVGSMPNLTPGDGELVIDYFGPIPSPLAHHLYSGGVIVKKTAEEINKLESEANFSFHLLMGRLNQELSGESILKLSPYSGALQSFCDWKNFSGVKEFLAALQAGGSATADEITVIYACFNEQGIDLGSY